ncbi:MAG: hypothetical protein ACRD3T_12885, partial [Terriglobia bacterium]
MKKPVLQYVILTVLLIIAVAFQTRLSVGIVGGVLRPYKVTSLPFDLKASAVLSTVYAEGQKAGLRPGDVLLAIDGRPYTGTVVLFRALERDHKHFSVTVRKPSGQVQTATVELPRSVSRFSGLGIRAVLFVLYLLMPAFCILLGFWVAFVRPRDSLAWLLLALMLGFSQAIEVHPETWGPVVRDLAEFYHTSLAATLPLWMFLFGLYFPEPFPPSKHGWLWRSLQWAMVTVLALFCLRDTAVAIGGMESLKSIAWLSPHASILDNVDGVLSFLAIGTFFGATCAKLWKA